MISFHKFIKYCFSNSYAKLFLPFRNSTLVNPSNQKIKPSLYSPYYAEACNEWRGPSPRLSAWATQLRRNVATVASRWLHCVDLTGPGIEPQTSRTNSVRFATELTAGLVNPFHLYCPYCPYDATVHNVSIIPFCFTIISSV